MDTSALLKKYNIAAPRYTSYPTVPYWETESFNVDKWKLSLIEAYNKYRNQGVSLYIHLPFCESLCTYCGCNTRITKNHGVERPYIEALLKEWRMYCDLLGETPKIKELHLGGGTPTFFSPENLYRLMNSISTALGNEVSCSFEAHPDNTTFEHLAVLYRLGFKRMSLGIQDFDPKVQMMINRFQTPEQVFRIMTEAREIGYNSINFDLIYGLPGQTPGGLTQTLNEVLIMRPERIAFYGYAHVPWTKPGQRHYAEKDIPQGEEKFALYQQGREILLNAGYQEIGMDHFALKKDSLFKASESYRLHRNFMGYTDKRTEVLIGLGVSAISDCKTAFAQNSKTVEEYLEKVNNGELPTFRGHISSDRDLYVREHILNLMCKGVTRFTSAIPGLIYKRLAAMLEDHLVEIDGLQLQITKDGRAFLRNVCMAFDERLWQKEPSTTLFSQSV